MQLDLPDPVTGEMRFHATHTRINPGMTRVEFLSTPEGQIAEPFINNVPHYSYKLAGPYEDGGVAVGMLLYFTNERLRLVTLFVASSERSWREWSAAQEQGNLAQLERLAVNMYGAHRDFPWGKVLVSLDPHSGSAGLHFSFSCSHQP